MFHWLSVVFLLICSIHLTEATSGVELKINGRPCGFEQEPIVVEKNKEMSLECSFVNKNRIGKLEIKRENDVIVTFEDQNSIEYTVGEVKCSHMTSYYCVSGEDVQRVDVAVLSCPLRLCPVQKIEDLTAVADPGENVTLDICVTVFAKDQNTTTLSIDGMNIIHKQATNTEKYSFEITVNKNCSNSLNIYIHIKNIINEDYGVKTIEIKMPQKENLIFDFHLKKKNGLKPKQVQFTLNGAIIEDNLANYFDIDDAVSLKCRFVDRQERGNFTIKKNDVEFLTAGENVSSVEFKIDKLNCSHMGSYSCIAGDTTKEIDLVVEKKTKMCEPRLCPNYTSSVSLTAVPGQNQTFKTCVIGYRKTENFPVLKIGDNYIFESTLDSKYGIKSTSKRNGVIKLIIHVIINNISEQDYGEKNFELILSDKQRLEIPVQLIKATITVSTESSSTTETTSVNGEMELIQSTPVRYAQNQEDDHKVLIIATVLGALVVCVIAGIFLYLKLKKRNKRIHRENTSTETMCDQTDRRQQEVKVNLLGESSLNQTSNDKNQAMI
ncbi:uncharacterized protein LOC131947842 [Physella acuta]|uniref:uncharacterized protein LOC131947842 n=1 Tax=Physella acuta TaxID=109671 RepID=UPI0027DD320F|nr:uncharacterized protein LOC131947842 [Physella acuta]